MAMLGRDVVHAHAFDAVAHEQRLRRDVRIRSLISMADAAKIRRKLLTTSKFPLIFVVNQQCTGAFARQEDGRASRFTLAQPEKFP
ncbi:MAG: hypothetical protein WKG07_19245 [Hymenobacter sp.]